MSYFSFLVNVGNKCLQFYFERMKETLSNGVCQMDSQTEQEMKKNEKNFLFLYHSLNIVSDIGVSKHTPNHDEHNDTTLIS